jgi:hypothetical protein
MDKKNRNTCTKLNCNPAKNKLTLNAVNIKLILSALSVLQKKKNKINTIKRDKSLNLLKKNAFKADFHVLTRVVQKLINKNEKLPISSHPNKMVENESPINKKTMLYKNDSSNQINANILGSPLI